MRFALILLVLAACNDPGSRGGTAGFGDGGLTTHVLQVGFDSLMIGGCVDGNLADADPNVPGPQFDCSVSEFANYGQANQVEVLLPECNNLNSPKASTNQPCWVIVFDSTNCPSLSHLRLQIERTNAPPPNGHVVAQCVAEDT